MRRAWVILGGAALLASACAGLAQMVGKARPLNAGPVTPPALRYVAGFELTSPVKAFGGLSGLALSGDAERALAVTDKGRWVRLRLDHAGERLTDVTIEEIQPILEEGGDLLPNAYRDIEAVVGDETLTDIVLSSERSHRLMAINLGDDGLKAGARTIAGPELFDGLGNNKGLEAVTRRREDGALIAVAEGNLPGERDHAGWIIDERGEDDAERFRVARIGLYKPTDLKQGPDGRFYLLERRFSLLAGFWFRLRRFEGEEIAPGAIARGRVLAEIGPPEEIDNMEGLALRRGDDGKLYVYLLSDDNFSALQRTLLLQFELLDDDGAQEAAPK